MNYEDFPFLLKYVEIDFVTRFRKSSKSLVSLPAMDTFRSKLPNGFDLPERISRLSELAYNLWWTWHPEAARIFARLDFDLWDRLGHNPIRLLREIGRPRLNQVANNNEYLAFFDEVFAEFRCLYESGEHVDRPRSS